MGHNERSVATDLGLLGMRLIAGGLMAGHGSQKLFGVFGGHGPDGTAGMMAAMGLQPAKTWAYIAGGSEFGSGLLTALGLVYPLAPMATFGPMITAWLTAHAGKPIWAMAGGAELPLVYMATAGGVALTGPGRYSLDELLGIEIPTPVVALFGAGVVGGIVASMMMRTPPESQLVEDIARDELEAGDDSDQSYDVSEVNEL
jgi:putative oxidoreductase